MNEPSDARTAQVLAHYGQASVADRIVAALGAAGLGEGVLTPADLAGLDQFHSRGLAATAELAAELALTPDLRVLDIGSGLGGPSRYLAATFGCRVDGIDLSPAFVEAATLLANRTALGHLVSYRVGNALDLPVDAASVDVAWTQHVAMNIADRARFYAEAVRVLRPAGRLAIYDVVAGPGGPPLYPVPWARTAETSFLMDQAAMRAAIEGAGFRMLSWTDSSEAGRSWFAEQRRRQGAGPPQGGLSLAAAMGEDFPTLSGNLARNLAEDRVGLVQAIAAKV